MWFADFRGAVGDLHGGLGGFLFAQSFLQGSEAGMCGHVFLGDFVDRGSEQLPLLCCLAQNKIWAGPLCQMVSGNHDVSNLHCCKRHASRFQMHAGTFCSLSSKNVKVAAHCLRPSYCMHMAESLLLKSMFCYQEHGNGLAASSASHQCIPYLLTARTAHPLLWCQVAFKDACCTPQMSANTLLATLYHGAGSDPVMMYCAL
jgi:hypothetical protein